MALPYSIWKISDEKELNYDFHLIKQRKLKKNRHELTENLLCPKLAKNFLCLL